MTPPSGTMWVNKWILLSIIIVFIVTMVYLFNFAPISSRSCVTLKAQGFTHIKQGYRRYNAALDNDHDGIACD